MAQIKTLLESLNQIEAQLLTPYTGKETVTETELTERDAREMTNKLIDAMREGMVSDSDVAYAALSYMSEYDVADLIRSNDWLWLEDEDAEVDESVEDEAEDELAEDEAEDELAEDELAEDEAEDELAEDEAEDELGTDPWGIGEENY